MKKFNFLLLGFVAGVFSASLGMGGGVILVSSLVLIFNYDIKKAIGTSLGTIIPTVIMGIITHYIINGENPKLFAALFIASGAIFGALLGAKLASVISGAKLKKIFAVLLLVIAMKLIGVLNVPIKAIAESTFYPHLVALGLITGCLSALLGIGGGVAMVPALYLFFGFSIHEAIPTSLLVILPTTFTGAIMHNKFHNIDIQAVKYMAVPALVGAILGALATNNVTSHALRIIFGVVLVLCSVRFFRQN